MRAASSSRAVIGGLRRVRVRSSVASGDAGGGEFPGEQDGGDADAGGGAAAGEDRVGGAADEVAGAEGAGLGEGVGGGEGGAGGVSAGVPGGGGDEGLVFDRVRDAGHPALLQDG